MLALINCMELTAPREIAQSARVGRTKLKKFPRFLCQPSFTGTVERGQAYVIVDDVATTGGTLAALRSHIVRGGGTVVGASTLAHTSGFSHPFGIGPETINVLQSQYGNGIIAYWQETFGHGLDSLSESEGQFLVDWGNKLQNQGVRPGLELLQRLRDRVNKAAGQCR